jgi:hypothetical protein
MTLIILRPLSPLYARGAADKVALEPCDLCTIMNVHFRS